MTTIRPASFDDASAYSIVTSKRSVGPIAYDEAQVDAWASTDNDEGPAYPIDSVAREHDVSHLSLLASVNAVGFYERMGYERIKRAPHETGGVELECVRMRTRLYRGSRSGPG